MAKKKLVMPPLHLTVRPRTYLVQSVSMKAEQEIIRTVIGDEREAIREADRLNPDGSRCSLIYRLELVGVGFWTKEMTEETT